ncbi:MAG: inositol monophosphatase [Desulfurococcaceae archaeon]
MVKPHELRSFAVRIADETAKFLRESIDRSDLGTVVKEGYAGDVTRKADLEAEQLIIELVKESNLCARIVSEEIGVVDVCKEPRYIVAVDPLDGSLNYINRVPFASVSIAIASINEPCLEGIIAGAISSVFYRETYSFDERLAYINEEALVRREDSNIFTIYSYSLETHRVLKESLGSDINYRLRILGSMALELAYVTIGRICLAYNDTGKLRNIDIAAGCALAKRVGLRVCDRKGRDLTIDLRGVQGIESLIVGPSRLVSKILSFLKLHG